MTSKEIELLGRQLEQDALADSLARLSGQWKNDISYPDMPPRSFDQDQIYNEELQLSLAAPMEKSSTEIAKAMRKTHEASRTQRDFEIIRAGRKKLMASCLDNAVYRWRKLDREIKAAQSQTAEAKA
jgi:hypothetical protein